MSNKPETAFELPFSFGEGFLQDHAGHIISDPRIALIELIANAYDAGATKVELHWPEEAGQPFVLTDNGTGMSRPEFERRWKTLCYNRLHEQGLHAENPNRIPGKKRVAFGYSGKGRHGAFCFADFYLVETWKDGVSIHARVEMTKDHNAPFYCNIESEGKKSGHGTEIRADVQRNLLTEPEVKELIGSKFAVDPAFTILVNNDSVQLLNLKHLVNSGWLRRVTLRAESGGEVFLSVSEPTSKANDIVLLKQP
jgi:hypothetical protein